MRLRDRQVVALGVYHAVNDGSLGVFLAVLPVMRVSLAFSVLQIGTILSAGLLATVIMQFLFGYMADIGSPRRLLIGGLMSMALIDLLFVRGADYLQVLILYLLLRGAAGVYHPVSFSTVFRTAENRSASMGFQSAFGDASYAFVLFSMGFVAESFGWQTPFFAWGILGLLGFFAFIFIIRSWRPTRSNGEDSSSRKAASGVKFTRGYVVMQFSSAFIQALFLVFTAFMPLLLNIYLQLSPGLSSLVVALWLFIGVASGFNAGRFVGLFGGERRTIRLSFAMATVLLAASTFLILRLGLSVPALVLLTLSGAPFFLTFPVLYGIVGIESPKNRIGLAYATNLSLSLLAGSVASYGVGILANLYTILIVLPILVGLALAASLTSLFL